MRHWRGVCREKEAVRPPPREEEVRVCAPQQGHTQLVLSPHARLVRGRGHKYDGRTGLYICGESLSLFRLSRSVLENRTLRNKAQFLTSGRPFLPFFSPIIVFILQVFVEAPLWVSMGLSGMNRHHDKPPPYVSFI